LRQLYLLVFWPTQYRREVEDESGQRRMTSGDRFRYLMRMFPWILGLPIVLNLMSGNLCDTFGVHFNWGVSWAGVAGGVAGGVAFGLAFGG